MDNLRQEPCNLLITKTKGGDVGPHFDFGLGIENKGVLRPVSVTSIWDDSARPVLLYLFPPVADVELCHCQSLHTLCHHGQLVYDAVCQILRLAKLAFDPLSSGIRVSKAPHNLTNLGPCTELL